MCIKVYQMIYQLVLYRIRFQTVFYIYIIIICDETTFIRGNNGLYECCQSRVYQDSSHNIIYTCILSYYMYAQLHHKLRFYQTQFYLIIQYTLFVSISVISTVCVNKCYCRTVCVQMIRLQLFVVSSVQNVCHDDQSLK